MLERFVNDQHLFVMYEAWSSGIMLDNKVNKESDQAKHSEHWAQAYYGSREKTVRQIEVLRFIKIGEARQNYFLNELNRG